MFRGQLLSKKIVKLLRFVIALRKQRSNTCGAKTNEDLQEGDFGGGDKG